jgi:hypothetical protein
MPSDLKIWIGLSLLAGIAAGGLVWFGWELAQNLRATRRSGRRKKNLVDQAAAIGRGAASDTEPPPPDAGRTLEGRRRPERHASQSSLSDGAD